MRARPGALEHGALGGARPIRGAPSAPRLDAEGVGDTVDVVEVRRDLHRRVDLDVAGARGAQCVDVLGGAVGGASRQLQRVAVERGQLGFQRRQRVFGGQRLDEFWGSLGPEVL
ncbi:MAG: hypothetical protein Kow0062_19190 [Acidobacteriota bacterium]